MKLKFSVDDLYFEGILVPTSTKNVMQYNVKVDGRFVLKGKLQLNSDRTFNFGEMTTSNFDVTNYPFEIAVFKREIIKLMTKKGFQYTDDYKITFNDIAKIATEGSFAPMIEKINSYEVGIFIKEYLEDFSSLEVNKFVFDKSLISHTECQKLVPKIKAFGFVKSLERTYEKPYTLVPHGNNGCIITDTRIIQLLAKNLIVLYNDKEKAILKFLNIISNNNKVLINPQFLNKIIAALF